MSHNDVILDVYTQTSRNQLQTHVNFPDERYLHSETENILINNES